MNSSLEWGFSVVSQSDSLSKWSSECQSLEGHVPYSFFVVSSNLGDWCVQKLTPELWHVLCGYLHTPLLFWSITFTSLIKQHEHSVGTYLVLCYKTSFLMITQLEQKRHQCMSSNTNQRKVVNNIIRMKEPKKKINIQKVTIHVYPYNLQLK